MARIERIDDERAAAALADLLNGTARKRPVVVVTVPSGRETPWIDVDRIAQEAGDLAEVYLMPTGAFTWEFSHRMVEGTQVYGGAGRVYPVGHEWASDLSKSPLRFAFDADDGGRATDHLVSDLFRMAAAAGLLQSQSTGALREASGTVTVAIAGRALVDIGRQLPAAVAEELTVEDVPIERILRAGQSIRGRYDAETNRLDVTQSLRPAPDALATYGVGDVVLTKVGKVRSGRAELMLYPRTSTPAVVVTVLRADVTTNPADDLRSLMTPGEVIPARVAAVLPEWALVLNDVDDDEPIVEAPPLLRGGPAWLAEESAPVASPAPQPLLPAPLPMPSPTPALAQDEVVATASAPPAPTAPPRPTPAMFDKKWKGTSTPPAAPAPPIPAAAPEAAALPAASTQSLLRKIDGLTAEVTGLEREAQQLREQLLAAADDREQLRYLLHQAERDANRAENELKAARARLRKASSGKAAPAVERPQFADAEQGFRYLVLTQWATRTLPAEQRDRPLGDYVLGPRFLDSLDKLEGIKPEKVADVVFEIVTGLATQLPSRELHRLRTGPGGDDPVRDRGDGAVPWRASLQVNTPSARRIHYWVLRSGLIELARVTTHDDFDA